MQAADFTAHRLPVLAVPCPLHGCGARVGVSCRRPSGHTAMTVHKERANDADRAWLDQGAPFLRFRNGRWEADKPRTLAESAVLAREIEAARAKFSNPEGDESMTKKTAKKATRKTPAHKRSAVTIDRTPDLSAPTPTIGLTHAQLYRSPLNPRTVRDKDEDAALLEGIRQHGVQVPLMARPRGGRWEIIMGNRRHEMVGLLIKEGAFPKDYELRVVERDCDDDELIELAGVENMGRKDMHPLDEANLIAHMRKRYRADADGVALDTLVAHRLGIKERTLYRRVALLRLATPLQQDLRSGKIVLQQAVAYALGTEKAQLTHRDQSRKNPTYMTVEAIRDAMTEKRAKVEVALFDADDYTGEILTDPDSGQRYFTNMAMFKELQDKAVRKKVKELKAKYGWVKEVEAHIGHDDYEACPPRDKKAGAVWWLEEDGRLEVRAPVKEIDFEETRAPDRKLTKAESKEIAERNAKYQAIDALVLKTQAELVADPVLGFRAYLAVRLNQLYFDPNNDFGHGDAEARTEGLQLKTLLPLIGDMYGAKNIVALAKAHQETRNEDKGLYLAFAALRSLKVDELVAVACALGVDTATHNMMADDKPELSPFGMVVLQRDLPLQAAAE